MESAEYSDHHDFFVEVEHAFLNWVGDSDFSLNSVSLQCVCFLKDLSSLKL